MPTKKKVTQKQKQKQSVVVNVNVAKARAKASAKKSGKKGGRGSVMMLPPPIYASPIDRLTPAMYGPQGQQIQQQSLDQMLKAFLSNQEKQKVGSFNTLGGEPQLRSTSEFIPYDESTGTSFRSLGSMPGSSSVSYKPKSYTSGSSNPDYVSEMNGSYGYGSGDPYPDNMSEMTDPSYMDIERSLSSETLKELKNLRNPFKNEERTYLKASEPDYDATAPQFSEKLKPKHSIYDTINQMEEGILKEEDLIKQSRKWLEDSYKNYPIKINKSPFDESSGSNQSLGSFPGMYGPRVPVNKSEQEGYFKEYYD